MSGDGNSLRGPKVNAYHTVLGKYVNATVGAPYLKKIGYICQVVMMLTDDELKATGIDIKEVGMLSTLTTTLDAAIEPKTDLGAAQIPWPFPRTPENFETYLRPWLDTSGLEHDQDIPGEFDNVFAFGEEEEQADAQFVVLARRLTRRSLRAVQVQFVRWALPKAMKWLTEISKLIEPDALTTTDFGSNGTDLSKGNGGASR